MILTKQEMVKKAADALAFPRVSEWYEKRLQSQGQGDTINTLFEGVSAQEITLHEALNIAFIVGLQWNESFLLSCGHYENDMDSECLTCDEYRRIRDGDLE